MYVAEMYRQSEVEYKILQHQQQQADQHEQAEALQAARIEVPDERDPCAGSEIQLDSQGVRAFAKDAFTRASAKDLELSNSTETFATAVLKERHPWRQDFTYTSTVASFQRRHSSEPLASASTSRRPTATALDKITPAASAVSSPVPRVAEPLPHSGSEDMTSTDTASPTAQRAPRPSRVCPLKGHGRDIFLIGVEDVSLPFVEVFSPYLPEAWVRATYMNHQTCMVAFPPAEDYDAAVNRVLDLAQESEEEIVEKQGTREMTAESAELIHSVPWLQLRRVCPSNAEWSVNKDGLVRRVIREVVLGTERLLDQCEV